MECISPFWLFKVSLSTISSISPSSSSHFSPQAHLAWKMCADSLFCKCSKACLVPGVGIGVAVFQQCSLSLSLLPPAPRMYEPGLSSCTEHLWESGRIEESILVSTWQEWGLPGAGGVPHSLKHPLHVRACVFTLGASAASTAGFFTF